MPPAEPELLYYDGACGLCHRAVRFVLARDPEGVAFRFAPIGGAAFRARVPPERQGELPDSIVVERAGDGALLERSDAFVHVLRRLGGFRQLVGDAIALVPRPLRDRLYDFVARNRGGWFRSPDDVCPVIPAHLRTRFET